MFPALLPFLSQFKAQATPSSAPGRDHWATLDILKEALSVSCIYMLANTYHQHICRFHRHIWLGRVIRHEALCCQKMDKHLPIAIRSQARPFYIPVPGETYP